MRNVMCFALSVDVMVMYAWNNRSEWDLGLWICPKHLHLPVVVTSHHHGNISPCLLVKSAHPLSSWAPSMVNFLVFRWTPSEEHFNQDGGLKVPWYWIVVMRRQRGTTYDVPWHATLVVHGYKWYSVCLHFFIFVLIQLKNSVEHWRVVFWFKLVYLCILIFGIYSLFCFFFIGMRGEPGNKASSLSSSGFCAAIVP